MIRLTGIFVIFAMIMAGACGCSCPNPRTPPSPQVQSSLHHDPVEDDPRYKTVFQSIDQEVNEILKDHPSRGAEGFVHIFWNTKQRILKQKYGIEWRSPQEMNPQVMFD